MTIGGESRFSACQARDRVGLLEADATRSFHARTRYRFALVLNNQIQRQLSCV